MYIENKYFKKYISYIYIIHIYIKNKNKKRLTVNGSGNQ